MIDVAVEPIDRVLSALDELIDVHPELESAVDFYEEVLPMMARARPSLHGLALNVEAARAKLGEGVPLLWGEFGPTSAPGVEPNVDLFMTLCRLMAEGGNEWGEVLMRSYLAGDLDLKALLAQALVQDHAGLAESARRWNVDVESLAALLRFLLTPIAHAYAVAFAQLLNFDSWRRGYCPVCGAWPILAELRGRDKIRYLDCGRCGASWKFRRLRCLWCGSTEQDDLSFLYDPEQPRQRVDVCDHCKGYVKTLVTFDPFDPEMLLVHDLETVAMDQTAANAGYRRPRQQPLAHA